VRLDQARWRLLLVRLRLFALLTYSRCSEPQQNLLVSVAFCLHRTDQLSSPEQSARPGSICTTRVAHCVSLAHVSLCDSTSAELLGVQVSFIATPAFAKLGNHKTVLLCQDYWGDCAGCGACTKRFLRRCAHRFSSSIIWCNATPICCSAPLRHSFVICLADSAEFFTF